MEYRRFELVGTFEHDKEIYIGPRSLANDRKHEGGGMISSTQTGFQVVTPFRLSNSK